MMSALYSVRIGEPRRARRLERLIGTNVLPVVDGKPIRHIVNGKVDEVYEVDLNRMSPSHLQRVAGYLSLFKNRQYTTPRDMLGAWIVPADDCELI